jgi:CheY-like chemotaxis protein
MTLNIDPFLTDLDSRFKLFHELMSWKVHDILLVSTPYDAWVLEEDCRLSERIITEYRGLNLSKPPRLTWVRSAEQALSLLESKTFDLVLTMSHLADMDPEALGRKIKERAPSLPVILLSHTMVVSENAVDLPLSSDGIDRTFMWSGDTDILVALIKSAEDRMNVANDTKTAGIRVILFVQESPYYLSSLLPILYRELVSQTQAVIESGLNEEHRLLTMRARPKILIAGSFEEALTLFEQFEPYVLGVISDVRIPRAGRSDSRAGITLLECIRQERFDIPMLLTGTMQELQDQPSAIEASFVDKRSPSLRSEVSAFFKDHLGFGDFVFTNAKGAEIGRAANLRELVQGIKTIPDEVLIHHGRRNDFSRWLFARTEIVLASQLRPITNADFPDIQTHRRSLVEIIQTRHLSRYKGIVVNFDESDFILETEFARIGSGSLGGKARGLAFVNSLLQKNPQLHQSFDKVVIRIPQTLVITTEGFETFIEKNQLAALAKTDLPDQAVAEKFLAGRLSRQLVKMLRAYLKRVDYPLAVRSSSLLEDAQHHAYAGLYQTYMLPNDDPALEKRLDHLLQAVKLVYASTYFHGPRAYARRVGHRTEEEKMAVIIQQLVGKPQGRFFYPSLSGVAQSRNYYPQARMKPEDGIVAMALGLGKMVVAGERTLRFSPKFPKYLPQRSTVDEILTYAQHHFYALQLQAFMPLGLDDGAT